MRGRTHDPWWGTAIEAPDPAALAACCSQLLGWLVVNEEPASVVLKPPQSSVFMVFQVADGYAPPMWPPIPGEQRPMMHLDLQVTDLEGAVADAVALGATVADHQPREHVRVMRDPVGHLFCLDNDADPPG